MDEFTVTEIDPDMGERAAHGVEEHEIAGLEFLATDLVAEAGHFTGGARQVETDRVAEHVEHQAAAVEAGLGRRTAKAVTYAEVGKRLVDQLFGCKRVFTKHRLLFGMRHLRLYGKFCSVGELGRREQDCQGEEGGSEKHSAEYTQATTGCKHQMSSAGAAGRTFITARANQTFSFWR